MKSQIEHSKIWSTWSRELYESYKTYYKWYCKLNGNLFPGIYMDGFDYENTIQWNLYKADTL